MLQMKSSKMCKFQLSYSRQSRQCKMQNEGVALGDLFQSYPQEIPQFCTLHFEFCISCVSTINCNFQKTHIK